MDHNHNFKITQTYIRVMKCILTQQKEASFSWCIKYYITNLFISKLIICQTKHYLKFVMRLALEYDTNYIT